MVFIFFSIFSRESSRKKALTSSCNTPKSAVEKYELPCKEASVAKTESCSSGAFFVAFFISSSVHGITTHQLRASASSTRELLVSRNVGADNAISALSVVTPRVFLQRPIVGISSTKMLPVSEERISFPFSIVRT